MVFLCSRKLPLYLARFCKNLRATQCLHLPNILYHLTRYLPTVRTHKASKIAQNGQISHFCPCDWGDWIFVTCEIKDVP